VICDILHAVDSGDLAVLTLLDLLAAFDTVDHAMLLRRLNVTYGLGGVVINWFTAYLDVRRGSGVIVQKLYHCCSAFHRGQSLGRFCFFCIRQIYRVSSKTSTHISTQMTHKYTVSAVLMARTSCKDVYLITSLMWRCGCDPTDCSGTSRSSLVLISSPPASDSNTPITVGLTTVMPVSAVRNLGIYIDPQLYNNASARR